MAAPADTLWQDSYVKLPCQSVRYVAGAIGYYLDVRHSMAGGKRDAARLPLFG